MEVILLEDVKSLGKKGERVTVSEGYARNCILKKKLGVEANAKNLNDLKLQKANEEKIAKVLSKIEWLAIFFFAGLFILVGALVETGVIKMLAAEAMAITQGSVESTAILILWMSAIASAFVDNIPFVATMIPLIKDMGAMGITNLDPLWWSLALGACLGGNGTLIGASANVVVASLAAQHGQQISFLGFMKVAFPCMILSIIISTGYVYLRYLM